NLSGGILNIDIQAPMVVPESCDLTFEIQVGGQWHPLSESDDGTTPLNTLPPLVPLRAVFTGTTTVMPGINLNESYLNYWRPRTVLKHISKEYTLASTADTIHVMAVLENYDEDAHDLDCTIR